MEHVTCSKAWRNSICIAIVEALQDLRAAKRAEASARQEFNAMTGGNCWRLVLQRSQRSTIIPALPTSKWTRPCQIVSCSILPNCCHSHPKCVQDVGCFADKCMERTWSLSFSPGAYLRSIKEVNACLVMIWIDMVCFDGYMMMKHDFPGYHTWFAGEKKYQVPFYRICQVFPIQTSIYRWFSWIVPYLPSYKPPFLVVDFPIEPCIHGMGFKKIYLRHQKIHI